MTTNIMTRLEAIKAELKAMEDVLPATSITHIRRACSHIHSVLEPVTVGEAEIFNKYRDDILGEYTDDLSDGFDVHYLPADELRDILATFDGDYTNAD